MDDFAYARACLFLSGGKQQFCISFITFFLNSDDRAGRCLSPIFKDEIWVKHLKGSVL